MILCLDVGNSHVFGGVFHNDSIQLHFRYATGQICTSDQFGLFLRQVLSENNVDPKAIEHIAICSVVPSLDYSLSSACFKYFNKEPFILKAGVKTGLKLQVQNPQEVGSDRIANAIAALDQFPNQDLVLLDFGTATTYCAITADKAFIGGAIAPGLAMQMQALSQGAAKLPNVEIVKIDYALGKNTIDNIQAGLYYGTLGASKEIIATLSKEAFGHRKPLVIGTGGFTHLFDQTELFDVTVPDLVLHGLRLALAKNL